MRICSIMFSNKNKKLSVKPKASQKRHHAGFSMKFVHYDILGPLHPINVEMLCSCHDRPVNEVNRVCGITKPDCKTNTQRIFAALHCDILSPISVHTTKVAILIKFCSRPCVVPFTYQRLDLHHITRLQMGKLNAITECSSR